MLSFTIKVVTLLLTPSSVAHERKIKTKSDTENRAILVVSGQKYGTRVDLSILQPFLDIFLKLKISIIA